MSLLLLFVCIGVNVGRSAVPSTETPIVFFTNVAERLLQSEVNLSVHRVQLYPTNQYTPAVHRLLQVTANLYDATTNRTITDFPYVPSVFRPLFTNDDGAIYISGYAEEVSTNLLGAPVRDLSNADDRAALQPTDMVYGVPIIIGARKGFPNFNEFAIQTLIYIRRRLEFRRPGISMPVNETNQMYIVGISNIFALEAWNSYTNPFPRDLEMIAVADVTTVLTNEFSTVLVSNRSSVGSVKNIPATNWTGFAAAGAFQVPLSNNLIILPTATYAQATSAFVPVIDIFERGLGFPVPHWWLNVDFRLRFVLVDVGTQRIVDYVNLKSTEDPVDIINLALTDSDCGTVNGQSGSQWCTNRVGNLTSINAPTYGIINQIHIGTGVPRVTDWNSFALDSTAGLDDQKAVDLFRVNLGLSPLYHPGTAYYKSNVFYAPFVPYRTIYQNGTLQANDPLVHHFDGGLNNLLYVSLTQQNPPLQNIGRINEGYEPWNRAYHPKSKTLFNPAFKDPLVARSDDWNFPSSQDLTISWLGSIHRGTPWQTIYLKSAGADPALWRNWTGVAQDSEAQLLQPTNDWRLAGLLTSLFNTNDPHFLVSVNETNAARWLAALDGIVVLTNSLSDTQVDPFLPPQLDTEVMLSNSPQASTIEGAIRSLRSIQDGQHFLGFGEILLATPELSLVSPWLNTTSLVQLDYEITDDAYERIPSQLLVRLRSDSIGSVIHGGQSLQIQFTGFDGYPYAIELSTNLLYWGSVSTNWPTNGVISLGETSTPTSPQRFYRSVLLN